MTQDPMPIRQVAAALATLAGPRGPWAGADRRELLRRQLLSADPVMSAGRILAVVASRPTLPAEVPVTWPDIEDEAVDLLAELGLDTDVRALLVRSLHDTAVRLVAIRALGQLAEPATAPALAAQPQAADLTQEELVHLVSALGCVGGPEALAAVQNLRRRDWAPAVVRELEIALQALGAP